MTSSKVTLAPVTADGNNAVSVNASTILQYPKPPPNISGKWISISALVSAAIKAGFSGADDDLSDEATAAENTWQDLLQTMQDENVTNRDRAIDILDDDTKEIEEYVIPYLESLLEMVRCGCQPDYASLRMQNSGGADTAQIEERYNDAREKALTYHIGEYNEAGRALEESLIEIRLRDTIRSRELVRQATFECNLALRNKAFTMIADMVQEQKAVALQYKDEGLKALAGMMQTYAWLATSKRESAKLKGNAEGEALANGVEAIFTALLLLKFSDKDAALGVDATGCKP